MYQRNKAIIVGLAVEALLQLSAGQYLADVRHLLTIGLPSDPTGSYAPKEDIFAAVRYHVVRGLRYCPAGNADVLLQSALLDPDYEVRAFAQEIIRRRPTDM